MFTQFAFSQRLISHPRLCFPAVSSLGFREFPIRVKGFRLEAVHFDTFLKRGRFCSDILVGRRTGGSGSWCCRGKGFEGEAILEAEILEFMNQSEKPEEFPTKEELVKGGRMDLVEAIVKKGGWLSMGWDLDDEVDEKEGFSGDYWETADLSIEDFQYRFDSLQECSSFKGPEVESLHSSRLASPSGRSLDMAVDISGIDGILNRLEKDRNVALGIGLGSNGRARHASNENDRDHSHIHNLTDANRAALRENSTPPTEMWRTWSSQRAGFTNTEFEAAEIYYDLDTIGWENGNSRNDRKFTKAVSEAVDTVDMLNEINSNQIQTRLQQLELELASTLHLLRSSTSKEALPKGHESSSSKLQKLSDEWEFQENEVINAKDKLRSIRAKLAILEGKMALAIIQSQKMLKEKQVRIDGARTSLQLLQTCCIVWPNTASEVLLTGSFDGWTTQRKMEKSKTGIFSVSLRLYPGRYEIKFIVDGVWKIDPLRPIVHNSGYENNLLIIT